MKLNMCEFIFTYFILFRNKYTQDSEYQFKLYHIQIKIKSILKELLLDSYLIRYFTHG